MLTKEEARKMAREGLNSLEKKGPERAIFLIQQALQSSPKDLTILNIKGLAHLRNKEPWIALQIFWEFSERFFEDSRNVIETPESLQEIQMNIDSALGLIEKEGVAHLRAGRPARAATIFEKALQFAPEKLTLRRWYVTVLEAQKQEIRAFVHVKNLAIELLKTATANMNSLNWERLNMAFRVYLPQQKEMVYTTAKNLLPAFVAAEKPFTNDMVRLKKVVDIFLPLSNV